VSAQPSPPAASLWGQLPAAHRRWIVFKAVIGTAAINLLLNGVVDWLGVRGLDDVSVWGGPADETSFFWSMILTFFLLPLITCLLVTTTIRRDVRLGSLEPLGKLREAHRWLSALPATRLRRGIAFGAIALVLFVPPLALALLAAGVTELTREQYVAWHVTLAVALGAVVTPAIALCAMAEPSE
jgi:hypothetical protein